MADIFTDNLSKHINFSYDSLDRVILRGYICSLFTEGAVINLLRNLGFTKHSNGVLKTFTHQLNSHIKKTAEKQDIEIHWWGMEEKDTYHSKIDFVRANYSVDEIDVLDISF